jgi:hypothetical protein
VTKEWPGMGAEVAEFELPEWAFSDDDMPELTMGGEDLAI